MAFPPAGGVLRAPPRAERVEGGACAASARGGTNCGPPQGQGRRPQGAARLGRWKRRGPRPRYAGRRVRRQSRAARPAPQAWPGWQGWPERRRPGRRGGRPHSPHIVGAGPPRSTYAATGEGEERGKAARSAHRRCLALRRGRVPPSNGAAQLDRAGTRRGPALGRTLPGLPQAGRAGGGTAAAQGGQGCGPQAEGAGGPRPTEGGADGSPLPLGAIRQRERKEGVPTGHSLLFADKGHTASFRKVLYLPPPPLG